MSLRPRTHSITPSRAIAVAVSADDGPIIIEQPGFFGRIMKKLFG